MSDGDYKRHHAVFVCKRGRGGVGGGGGGAEGKAPDTVMGPARRTKRAVVSVGTAAADR